MKVKEVYDKCYKEKKLSRFEDYDRNVVLKDFFPKFEAGAKILDLGCGDGAVSDWLRKQDFVVTSADFNEHAVNSSRTRNLTNVIQLDVEQHLPFDNNYFDSVFWGDVVEHIFDPEGALREINRILKGGGKLVLSCPNVGYVGFRLKFLLTGSIRSVELAGQEPWEQEHIRFFNSSDLRKLLEKIGFVVRRRVGVNRLWHSRKLVRLFPDLLGYIQLVEAEKI